MGQVADVLDKKSSEFLVESCICGTPGLKSKLDGDLEKAGYFDTFMP